MQMPKILADFSFAGRRELRRTLQLTRGNHTYRLEVFYSYSTPKNPWGVEVYKQRSGAWKRVKFPWVDEKGEESALRLALSFIQDGKAH